MKSKSCQYNENLFNLSREGARFSGWNFEFTVDKHKPTGSGVSLVTECSGDRLVLWIPEKEWCEWVSLQVPVSSFRETEKDLLPVIADWLLSPLSTLLHEYKIPAFEKVTSVSAGGPVHSCWRVSVSQNNYILPIYMKQVPDKWWLSVMTLMNPSKDLIHEFPLSLGWALLERDQWKKIVAGDAVSLVGVNDSLSCFHLCVGKQNFQLNISGNGSGMVSKASSLLPDNLAEDLHVIWLDVGVISLSSSALSGWEDGKMVEYNFIAYPEASLRINMWSVRLKTKSSKAGRASRSVWLP